MLSAEEIAELLIHLGRAARSEDQNAQLTPAQWTALRYLARANTASRTPSAFASFHATTRGTATQTLKALEGKALICRGEKQRDGRAVCYDLTESGRGLLDADPLRDLIHSVADLPPVQLNCLGEVLPALVAALAARRDAPSFGTCHDCRHFDGSPEGAFCACMSRVLAACDTGQLCVNFNKDVPPKLR